MITTGSIDDSYKSSTYDQLSKKFRELFRKAVRAFQLIPLMYNRLTETDGLSHKEARTKILNDHKDLPGFSTRNFYRYLPPDNPGIPRRVVTPRHKTSITNTNNGSTYSNTELNDRSTDDNHANDKGLSNPQLEVLQQEHHSTLSKAVEEESKQKEREFFEKIKQQQDQIIELQHVIEDQEKELEKLRPLSEEEQQVQQSQVRKENVDLKEQLEKLREENSKFRAELDESKKQDQIRVLVDEWTLSKQLLSLRYSNYSKLHIVIENNKFVEIEGVDEY